MNALVIGGGAIGVASAYYLARHGFDVTVVERGELGAAASYGNAGLIVPSFSVPLASPEAIAQGVRWLFDRSGPLTIKPRLDAALWRWLARFIFACRPSCVKASTMLLTQLGRESAALHAELAGSMPGTTGYERKGWLYVYGSAKGFREGLNQAKLARECGTRSDAYRGEEVNTFEPMLRSNLVGAIHYPEDAQVRPHDFVSSVARLAATQGVRFVQGVAVKSFEMRSNSVAGVVTDSGTLQADMYVVAAGVWSSTLARFLGLELPVEPAKGYSLTYSVECSPMRPLMLGESHVVVTPSGSWLRVTGGMDLIGLDERAPAQRFAQLQSAVDTYLHDIRANGKAETWSGFRPLTPDGLPIIGRSGRYANLIFATGHGTLGITLAPITGSLVAKIAAMEPISRGFEALSPIRFAA